MSHFTVSRNKEKNSEEILEGFIIISENKIEDPYSLEKKIQNKMALGSREPTYKVMSDSLYSQFPQKLEFSLKGDASSEL